jgi:predicted nucleotidyltransferase
VWREGWACVTIHGMARIEEASGRPVQAGGDYVAAHVERALARERARQALRVERRGRARSAAAALRASYGAGVAVHLFGSVVDAGRFRLGSDIDLAVVGLPADRYYEAWAVAEKAAGTNVDLIRLEDAPAWLAEEVRTGGERLA